MYKLGGRTVMRLITVLVLCVATGWAFSTATGWSTGGIPNNILVFGSVDSVTTWDPSASYSTELTYLANIYEPLLWVNPPGSEETFTPALAESWEVSSDGLVWTFHLRKGVKFHDGEPFNAEAVKYSFERTMEMGLGAAFILSPISEINVLDDYTVQFVLKYAAPLDRIVASAYAAWIMSPKSAEQGRDWFEAGNEAGTGPYKLVSWKPDEEIILEKFEDYWGGWEGPHFDKIMIKIIKEAIVMLQMLEAGEADLVTRIPPESFDEVEAREDLEILRGPSFMNYAMHINTTKPPLDNKLVRQAISYATPYEDAIEVSVAGWGRQAVGPIPYGQFGHNETESLRGADADRALGGRAEPGADEGVLRPGSGGRLRHPGLPRAVLDRPAPRPSRTGPADPRAVHRGVLCPSSDSGDAYHNGNAG